MAPRLKEMYKNEIISKLEKDLDIKNVNLVPKLEKIVVNMGVGAAASDSKQLDAAIEDMRFMDRLLATALPRVRDFRGISRTSFDGRGNYSLGITEQLIFPEIDYDKIDRTRGMDITFVTTADNDEAAFALLDAFGFPFKEN